MEKITCKQCGKKFDSSRSLEQHTAAKHSSTATPTYQPGKVVVAKKFTTKKIGFYAIIFLILGVMGYGLVWALTSPSQIGPLGSTHIHTDFAVFLDGNQITPLGPKYFVRASHVHVEEGAGEGVVIHMHATGVSLGNFFNTLGMKFDQDCFVTDNKVSYCNTASSLLGQSKTIKMFIKHAGGNWTQSSEYDKYVFTDLDKILITYGNETPDQLQQQMNSVTDFSRENSGTEMPL